MQTAGAGSAEAVRVSAGGAARGEEVVWARGRVATEECPKSLVTPRSFEWIEKFLTWKFAGGGGSWTNWPARDADAFLILEREWRNGERQVH